MCSDSFRRDLIQDSHTFRVFGDLILTMILEHSDSYRKILIQFVLKIKEEFEFTSLSDNRYDRKYENIMTFGK